MVEPRVIHIDGKELAKITLENQRKIREEFLSRGKEETELICCVEGKVNSCRVVQRSEFERYLDSLKSFYGVDRYGPLSKIDLRGNSLVNELYFELNVLLMKGDEIKAYIFAGKREEVPFQSKTWVGGGHEFIYIPRNLEKIETAFTIEKIVKGEVVATYTTDGRRDLLRQQ